MSRTLTNVIMAKNPACPKYADILFGAEFINRVDLSVFSEKGKYLVQPAGHRFGDLGNMAEGFTSIGYDMLAGQVGYDCPWTGNRFVWLFPLGILTNTPEQYISTDMERYPWRYRKIGKGHFMDFVDPFDPYECGDIVNSHLGHGYTAGTLPSDGTPTKITATMSLDNDDEILVICWTWSNK